MGDSRILHIFFFQAENGIRGLVVTRVQTCAHPIFDHGIEAGENGAKVMDIFSPPRDQYKKSGSGFGV